MSVITFFEQDISLITNNDEQISHIENVDHPGCDADFRFHEGRDDFSIDSRSAVKITFKVRILVPFRIIGANVT